MWGVGEVGTQKTQLMLGCMEESGLRRETPNDLAAVFYDEGFHIETTVL